MLYNKSMKELSELLEKKEIKSLDIALEQIQKEHGKGIGQERHDHRPLTVGRRSSPPR